MNPKYAHHLNADATSFVPSGHTPRESLSADADVFNPVEFTEYRHKKQSRIPPASAPMEMSGSPTVYPLEYLLSLRESVGGVPAGVEIPKWYAKVPRKKKKPKKKRRNESGRRNSEPITPILFVAQQCVSLKELRILLNKVSMDNFDKIKETLKSFTYSSEVVHDFSVLILRKRNESFSFIEIYARLCKALKSVLKTQGLSEHFVETLQSLCEQYLNEESKVVTKLIGQLFKFKVLKTQTVFRTLHYFLEHASDSNIEAFCSLLKDYANYLAFYDAPATSAWFSRAENFAPCSKKTQFKLMDLLDNRNKLLEPKNPKITVLEVPKVPSKVKFVLDAPSKQPEPSKTTSILKKTLTIDEKHAMHAIVRGFYNDRQPQTTIEEIRETIGKSTTKQGLYVCEIYKFSLIEYDQNEFFRELCDLFTCLNINQSAIEAGLKLTEDRLEDIKLDAPHAPNSYGFIVQHLSNLGLIHN